MASVSAPDHEIIVVTPDMTELRQQCYDIRTTVFVGEQGFSVEDEFDQWDENSTHLLLRLVPSLKPIGTVRPIHTPSYYKLSRLAVLKEYRRFSFGRALVHGLHGWVRSDAMKNGCEGEVKIRAHSQLPAKGFYTKHGYIPEGDEFDEDGAPHQLMIATVKLDRGFRWQEPARMSVRRRNVYSAIMLVLSHADVDALIADIPPNELSQLMADVFRRFSEHSGIQMPPRSSVQTNTHTTLFMPSRVDPHGTAVKVVSVPTRGGPSGLPATTLVMDEVSGGVKAVVNSRNLTAIRTAAGSLLATKLALSPNASPRHLVVFGAGAQVATHITLFLRHYPSLTQCIIYNRSLNARVERLSESLRREFASVTFICRQTPSDPHGMGDDVNRLQSDINSSDIICTATSSSKALFPSSFVRAGTHLNLVGSYTPHMVEVETSLIRRAGLLMVDSRSACLLEAGELIAAGVRPEDMREVGELVGTNPKCPHLPDLSGDKVTVFKSVGLSVQDVVIAKLVVDLAERRGVGCKLNSYDDRDTTFG